MTYFSKTIVEYTDTALPVGLQSVTLFNSVIAFPPGKAMQNEGCFYWFTWSILTDQNATGNVVTGQFSNNKGVTWNTYYTAAVVGGTHLMDEVFIEPFKDVRFLFTNGAVTQTVFLVNMSLSSKRAPASTAAGSLINS